MSKPTDDVQNSELQASALAASLDSMFGYSPYIALIDVYDVARTKYGFAGTLDDVVSLLPTIRDVAIESAGRIEDYRVVVNSAAPKSFE